MILSPNTAEPKLTMRIGSARPGQQIGLHQVFPHRHVGEQVKAREYHAHLADEPGPIGLGAVSVSYTHLDVYKRQRYSGRPVTGSTGPKTGRSIFTPPFTGYYLPAGGKYAAWRCKVKPLHKMCIRDSTCGDFLRGLP